MIISILRQFWDESLTNSFKKNRCTIICYLIIKIVIDIILLLLHYSRTNKCIFFSRLDININHDK